ncbi:unnamed protein product, partial [Effrenium voratum]
IGCDPATLGLSSLIGVDSPSISLRGSFNNSDRPAWMAENLGPGPADYKVLEAERVSSRSKATTSVKILGEEGKT